MPAASETLSANLQRVLVNLVDLQLLGKQAHWNITGKNFRDIHLQLDEIIELARSHGDLIAERLRALEAEPDGRAATVSRDSDLPDYPDGLVDVGKTVALVVEALDAAAGSVRSIRDQVDEEDPATTDLLHAIILDLEKQRWMLSMEAV
ncbi:Dps family protein [Sediminivirga luteola]|uniref:Putative starvation-induced DNA protecting protein/ferritin and Dps n=1 Tax=Sediminivirga luteola TaxID=1774748 RepID=A0A8J2TVS9_9MICO|nr:DNA starvation/stationary phase protection protein [Sediminivirga luteola]MCI2265212.1 DNA starvation/stationary phase protection protein [Sediminivirga luteola]GGA05136.1 putative starvation-induced DNA protecting protein/ferritin and Dps [Sediminivirga luteola]